MAKPAINKKYSLTANGFLDISDDVCIENVETGEVISLKELLSDFNEKYIKLSISYDEDYYESCNN